MNPPFDPAQPVSDTPTHMHPTGHPPFRTGRLGVLLVNLGTPDSASYGGVRRYLSEFLSDRRVIEVPQWLWQPILQGVILSTRPFKSGAAYRTVWREDTDEAPLRYFTRRQADALAKRFAGQNVMVDWAMRYGAPSIRERITAMKDAGCDRIMVLPLYPQYSATTTATVVDATSAALKSMRWQPSVRMAPPFHDDEAYIGALATNLSAQISALAFEPDMLVLSFHGLPQAYFDKGDPYHCHSLKTARLLRERMGWSADRVRVTFQSRFGPTQWLQPYTDAVLEALPSEGVRRVAVAMPGFVSDCLETLEEIAVEARETFLDAGGEHFAALSCLNDSEEGVDMLETLARRELSGWL